MATFTEPRSVPAQPTTASGPMICWRCMNTGFSGTIVFIMGTGSTHRAPTWRLSLGETNGGLAITDAAPSMKTSAAIMEVRLLSGLTWEQLARLFRVARRSLHFWASGAALSAANEEHLRRTLGVLSFIDRGSARENRALLLQSQDDRESPFGMLAQGKYREVCTWLGEGSGRRRVVGEPFSGDSRAARVPPKPAEMIDMPQDEIVQASRAARIAKSVRLKKHE